MVQTPFGDRDGWIWMDGAMVPWREAKVHVLTHTLHYGMGVFEGVRAYKTPRGTAIFRLAEHTRRLLRSAHVVGMTMPFDEATLQEAQRQVVARNGLEAGYLRPLAFYGDEAMGLHAKGLRTHVMIAAWPWPTYLGDEALEKGLRVKTSSFVRCPPNAMLSKAKAVGPYINSIMALAEVNAAGYDEALLLDGNGHVAEGSGENIFVVRDGVLFTPETVVALDGITRATVITLAREQGFEVRERRLTRDDIYLADEAFFTGTAAEVTPIRELDDRRIGAGTRGPVTTRLQKAYLDLVHGRLDVHDDWLTLVQ